MNISDHAGAMHRAHTTRPEVRAYRGVNFVSDYTGCGMWRMIWPSLVLSTTYPNWKEGHPAFHIENLSTVVYDQTTFFNGVRVVRVQRPSTDAQCHYLREVLLPLSKRLGFTVTVDYDDWLLGIPLFNQAHKAYDAKTLNNIASVIRNIEFITVSTSYMKFMMNKKLGTPLDKILVLPNRMPKFLFDRHEVKHIEKRGGRKMKVLWTGSSSHVNVMDPSGADDVVLLRKLIEKYNTSVDWHIIGLSKSVAVGKLGFPDFINFHDWVDVHTYISLIRNVSPDLAIIPLLDCDFNKAKSNIKLLEFGAMGIPCTLQELEPYKFSTSKFTNFESLVEQFETLSKNPEYRSYIISENKAFINDNHFWLEDPVSLEQYKRFYSGDIARMCKEKLNETIA